MQWQDKHIVWGEDFFNQRREEARMLEAEGAMHHTIMSGELPPETDLILAEEKVVPGECIPVIRSVAGASDQLRCDVLDENLPARAFLDRLCRWRNVRSLSRMWEIDDTAVVNRDTEESLRRLAGADVLYEGRRKFLRSAEKYIHLMEKYNKRGDWEEVTKVLHTLKGSSGTIGASRVSKACRIWEDRFDASDQDIQNQLSLLKTLVEYFRYQTLDWK